MHRFLVQERMALKRRNTDNLSVLLDRARHYCSLTEQCEDAVRQKLVTWGATPTESDQVTATLYNEGYIDDIRYAKAYCESKILHQHWGRQKVLYQLRLKHLPRRAVDAGMAAVSDDDYRATLATVAEKKRQELCSRIDDPLLLRKKLMAFLASRGFTVDEIKQVITNNNEEL